MTSKEALNIILKPQHTYIKGSGKNNLQEVYTTERFIAISVLQDLVDKDTPIKVIKEADKKYVDTYEFYERDIYRCGSCKKVLIKKLLIFNRHRNLQDNEKTNYCYHCGQKLLW